MKLTTPCPDCGENVDVDVAVGQPQGDGMAVTQEALIRAFDEHVCRSENRVAGGTTELTSLNNSDLEIR